MGGVLAEFRLIVKPLSNAVTHAITAIFSSFLGFAVARPMHSKCGAPQGRHRAMPEFSVKLKVAAEPDRELLLLMPEIFIFSSCLEIIQKMRRLELKFQKGRMERSVFLKRITLLLSHLAEMAGATERFNILMPVLGVGQFSPFFWKWFNWWNDYRRTLTRAEISYLERLGKAGNAELDNYRPAGDWLHYRQAPALALQIVDSGE